MYKRGVVFMGLGPLVSWVAMSGLVCLGAPQGNLVNTVPRASTGPYNGRQSPTIARLFGDMANELMNDPDTSDVQLDCATVFLSAAGELDRSNEDVQRLLLDLARERPAKDLSPLIHAWLEHSDYASDDIGLVKDSIAYLASRLRTGAEREQYLETILSRVHGRNVLLDSYLQTELGLLMIKQNNPTAARSYLTEAYENLLYNRVAFEKLVELVPDQITPEMYFEHLRFLMRKNPLDIDTALAFAQYAERLELYSLAVGGYDYCVELYYYLYPGKPLPAYIYMPWAISNYNVKGSRHKVTQIATRVRNTGEFNLFLEALAGRAAQLLGDEAAAQRIFTQVEKKAAELHARGPSKAGSDQTGQTPTQTVGPKQFAWYYCFARPDKDKAVEWANLAYSDSESEASESLLAYALVLNEQWKWAKPIAEKHDTQIALLALAMIQLNEGQESTAIKTLDRSISKDPGSLMAERAKALLIRHGSHYPPPAKTAEVLSKLAEEFGELIVPRFTAPEKLVSLRFETPTQQIAYGQDIQGIVTLVNSGDEPLLVSNTAMIQGAVRIDAQVQGDLTESCEGLITRKLFADRIIESGKGLPRTLRLDVGCLGRLLHAHPQANLDIQFTLYLDPVETDPNTVKNRITSIKPIRVRVRRPAVAITSQSLNQQYNDIALVDFAQRMRTADLFVGLLREQQVMASSGVLYHFKYADWMAGRLESAFTSDAGLLLYHTFDEWEAKAQVLVMLRNLDLSADLTQAVARHINNPYWPVRLVTLYLLARSHGRTFKDVLEYQVRNETNRLVRDMAQALERGMDTILLPVRK